ncbi:MAG TPA: hypothetical protein VHA77_06560 [Xanthobacteraceae bacterium]|nr:hypothetical protein [Xanthobacteraceae bacterium]
MILTLLDCETDSSFIADARKAALAALGLPAHGPGTLPLPHAVYLGLFLDGDARPKGLAEAYFLNQAFAGFEACPYKSPSFANVCPFDRMSWIRTIYVVPEFRRQRPFYLYLSLAMARIFRSFGATHAGMTTRADDPFFDRLYLRTGGTLQGYTAAPFFEHARLALYTFDLEKLLQHPRFPSVSAGCQFDWGKLKAIRARRSNGLPGGTDTRPEIPPPEQAVEPV